jgi:hypothetical protein
MGRQNAAHIHWMSLHKKPFPQGMYFNKAIFRRDKHILHPGSRAVIQRIPQGHACHKYVLFPIPPVMDVHEIYTCIIGHVLSFE